jgi:glycosyltransferase involved in cell wall biosynthesis
MRNGKIIVARFWPKFGGDIPSRTPVILGINPQKYETICIYLTKNSDNPNIFEQKGKKVFYITQKPYLPFFKPAVFFKLAAILKKEGVDILHCHKHKSVAYGSIAGRLAKVPVILAHVHGMDRTRNFRRKFINRFVLSPVDKILAVSQAVKNDILQNNSSIKPEKVINVGNSINYDYFTSSNCDRKAVRNKFNIPQNAFVFATAGRLAQTKGQEYLITAFTQVRKQLNNAELLIAGTGEMKNELENLVSRLNCNSSVHFLNHVDDMREFYSAADCFVLPSIAEGMPRSLIEAMAWGVFCIASNVGGISEILNDGSCGLLVPPKDANALTDAMLKAANMPADKKTAVLSKAKEFIRNNYSHDVMIKKIEQIYDALAAEKIR